SASGSDLDFPKAPRPASGLPAPAPPIGKSRSDPIALLREVKRTALPDGVRLSVELDAEVTYYQEEISNPRRVFFDLKNVKAIPALQDTTLKFQDEAVKEVRLGRPPQNTTRLFVDLDGVSSYTVYPLYGPYRLVIDL